MMRLCGGICGIPEQNICAERDTAIKAVEMNVSRIKEREIHIKRCWGERCWREKKRHKKQRNQWVLYHCLHCENGYCPTSAND
jgi:hypothetical protein